MPGNIGFASPSAVMPQTLCLAFSESREYVNLENSYHDGSRQASLLAQTSRATFRLSRRLTASQLATLKAFWDSMSGGMQAFYFYNPWQGTPPGSNYDPAGLTTTGRHTVVFRGDWVQQTELGRSVVPQLELAEVV